jgi:hypothetical protein
MRQSTGLPLLAVVAALVVGCAGGSGAASTQPSPSSLASASTAWLRASTLQGDSPVNRFAVGPTAVITADGTYVTAVPADAKDPKPLLPTLVGKSLSDAGREAIQVEAKRLGMAGRKTDFRGVLGLPGAVLGRLQLTVDGEPITLIGEPDSKLLCIPQFCDPVPGTPEAFGELWRKVADPTKWLADDLGPETAFVPSSYALLVGPSPGSDGAGASIADWPLATPLATFGAEVANGARRCGIVSGADADTLRPALEEATVRTRWIQDAGSSAAFEIAVRPIIAGEDPCAQVFGS